MQFQYRLRRQPMIKVMLVDDQKLIVDGLKLIINLEEDMEVIHTAQNGQEAIKKVDQDKPDVILMDIRMPVMNGVEATKILMDKYKDLKIIMVTTFDDDDYILEALANGATGYLLKNIDSEKVVNSIRDAYKGNLLLDGIVAQKLAAQALGSTVKQSVHKDIEMSQREREIATLMVQGLSAKEIAQKLHLTTGTVKNYVSNIYSELGTNERGKAILLLQELGF